jgi:N-acetylglucosamine-6-sulfatase
VKRRALFLLLLLSGLVITPPASLQEARSVVSGQKPNILFILADDMRADDLKFMPETTRLLGEHGTTFERAYVTTSLCCPSRATILTGRYAHNHGVLSNVPPYGGFQRFRDLGRESSTIATRLDSVGYRTALMGKYLNGYKHHGHVPVGWDEWFARTGGASFSDNGQPFTREGVYNDDLLADRADGFVRSSTEPFFLYLSIAAPHQPANYPKRYAEAYPDAAVPQTPSYNESDVSDKPAWVSDEDPLSAVEKKRLDDMYRDRVRSLLPADEAVERLVNTLKEQGELDDTYVVFTSDNGFHMGGHRLDPGKTTAYEEDIHVPLLIRGPGVDVGKERRLALNTDLAPTFARWGGFAMEKTDGRSLAPLLSGNPAQWRSAFLVENLSSEGSHTYGAVRTETRLYVEYSGGERELYNTARDPLQLKSLYDSVDPAIIKKLEDRLNDLRNCTRSGCRAAEGA